MEKYTFCLFYLWSRSKKSFFWTKIFFRGLPTNESITVPHCLVEIGSSHSP